MDLAFSLLFAAMVLAVFYTLQDFGPESTIRKFHQRLKDSDRAGILAQIEQGADSVSTIAMVNDIGRLMSMGANPVVRQMERTPHSVIAQVNYRLPNGAQTTRRIVVEQVPSRAAWLINSDASGYQNILGF